MSNDVYVKGVSRMVDNDRALILSLTRALTDDEMRRIHEWLRSFSLSTVKSFPKAM